MSDSYDIEGMYAGEGSTGGGAGKGAGITREVKSEKTFGKQRGTNPMLLPFSRADAYLPGQVQVWHVSKADRMETVEARMKLERILDMFDLLGENANVQAGFLDAMLFCHTVNSGSTLQPGRSKIYLTLPTVNADGRVTAVPKGYDFNEVVQYLNVDLRRFFRAFADETRRVNKKVLAQSYDMNNYAALERRDWLLQVAAERDLSRYPELAHDSSDACSGLTPNEQAAIAMSKKSIFSSIQNVADSITRNPRTREGHNPYSANPALGRGDV